MKLSGELDYRISYDVEHDLFHAQNVFNDEYIKPTFIEYVQKLEKENAELKRDLEELTITDNYQKVISNKNEQIAFLEAQCTRAKELLTFWVNDFYDNTRNPKRYEERHKALVETEHFIKECKDA